MMAPNMIPALMVPLAAFAIYRRVRGNSGPQPIRRKRMMARVAIFAVLAVVFALTGLYDPMLLAGLGIYLAVPTLSSALMDFRLPALLREGVQVMVRTAVIWYMLQPAVRDAFV